MLSKIFKAQWNYPAKRNEWTEQARTDMAELGLDEELSWLKKKSKQTFKKLVKEQVKELALMRLNEKKEGHTKMTNLEYATLDMQEYLKNIQINTTQAKILFCFRTRMAQFSENYKAGKATKLCPVCNTSTDEQKHSFECKRLREQLKYEANYMDIFTSKIGKQVAVTLERIVKTRETYLET